MPKSENEDDELFNVNAFTQNKIQSTLRELKKKGRSIRMYYESENLSVYELTNKSNATKINDILLSREN
jgi:DNA-binding HxlR family transcriptional regulator